MFWSVCSVVRLLFLSSQSVWVYRCSGGGGIKGLASHAHCIG